MAVNVQPTSVYASSQVGVPSSVTPIRTPILGSTATVSVPTVVAVQTNTIMPTEFFIYRGYEGPQLIITWEPPSPALTEAYRLVRKEFDFPQSPTDGVTVFTTEDGVTPFFSRNYADLPVSFYEQSGITGKGIVASKVYFYRFFAKELATGKWVSDEVNLGRGMGVQTGYFAQKLWDSLPDLYHAQDGNQ